VTVAPPARVALHLFACVECADQALGEVSVLSVPGMTNEDVRRQRCANQRLRGTGFGDPAEVVPWLGAVQSQEFALAKWAVAQRCADPAAALQKMSGAIADGRVLRTHVLRPTWHFVHRDDIRWLLDLTAPRVQARAQHRHRELGISASMATADFQWWSTLSMADVRAALGGAGPELESVDVSGRTYWLYAGVNPAPAASPVVQLIHQFDEYLVGYTESRDVMDAAGRVPAGESLSRLILIDGEAVGRWRGYARGRSVELELLRPLTRSERRALDVAIEAMTSATM
jgi:hypothetical protein